MKLRVSTVLTTAVAVTVTAGIAAPGIAAAQPASAATAANAAAPTVIRTPCPGGTWAITTKPAKGFSPLTATAAQLEANNYPAPPPKSHTAAYSQWKKFVLTPAALASACPNTKPIDRSSGGTRFKTAVTPDGVTSTASSENWSGYMEHGATYTEAEATWHVPGVLSPVSGTNEYSSAWVGVGLGQSSRDQIYQAGTESDYVNGKQQNYMWYELWPLMGQVPELNVSPGDAVGAHVTYNPGGPIFHIWDTNKNFNTTFQFGFAGGDDGHAEWIYERTTINNRYPYLASAPPTFSSAQGYNGSSWKTLSAASDVQIYMDTCGLVSEMADAEAIQGTSSFTAHFDSHGDNDVCGP